MSSSGQYESKENKCNESGNRYYHVISRRLITKLSMFAHNSELTEVTRCDKLAEVGAVIMQPCAASRLRYSKWTIHAFEYRLLVNFHRLFKGFQLSKRTKYPNSKLPQCLHFVSSHTFIIRFYDNNKLSLAQIRSVIFVNVFQICSRNGKI